MSAGGTPHPACPMCGGGAASLLTRGPDYEYGTLAGREFSIWRCAACGHAYIDPVPTPEELPDLYPPTYYTVNPASPIHFEGRILDLKLGRDVDRIARLAAEGPRPDCVVDLGCGDAERLARLGERLGAGVELVGVDLEPDPARAAALATRGVRMLRGNVEAPIPALADGCADLVLMSHIIEHLRDPVAALREVARLLAPGGRVLLDTPNLGGPDFRLFHTRYWGAYHTPRHFHLFTPETLAAATRRAGLRPVASGFQPGGFMLVSLRSALGLDSARRQRRFGEFLNMGNWLVVGALAALDLAWIALGGQTSNQYLVAQRPADGTAGAEAA